MSYGPKTIAGIVLAFALISRATADEIVLDFETLADGVTHSGEFQELATEYADSCVVFRNAGTSDDSKSAEFRRFSPGNTIVWDNNRVHIPAPGSTFNIAADFLVPVSLISADAIVAVGETLRMTAFDASGSILGSDETVVSDSCCSSPIDTLSISGVGEIRTVVWETSAPRAAIPSIDNLSYSTVQPCNRSQGSRPPSLSQFIGIPEPGRRVWLAKPIASQIPGSFALPGAQNLHVSLWFNDYGEFATVRLDESLTNISQLRMHCAVAGTEGPLVWDSLDARPLVNQDLRIFGSDLITTDADDQCGMPINNVATLKAAADERRLYVELERRGQRLRGQLWPRSINLQKLGFVSIAGSSDQQAVDAEHAAPQWIRTTAMLSFSEFTDTLDYVGYTVPQGHSFRAVNLHCAPAGRNGDIVAPLPLGRGVLSNLEIIPASSGGPCGMEVNGVASLLEAVLRGNVYVSFEPHEHWKPLLRGQFQHP